MYQKLGNCKAELQEFDEAIKYFLLALNISQIHSPSRTCLADVYFRMGEYDKGYEEYQWLLANDPEWAEELSRYIK